ncbi:hypothetical protein AB0M41_37990 [Streptomyces sp. NPDC051896]|uniref:hypothetical protein n=1 Tax=Streptomyces sp. NPDC051896 TaxID=3155416 RepID=UPI003435AC18
MGVFARLLGRSKATPEASAAEAQAGAEPEAEAEETGSAEAKAAGSAEATGPAGDGHEDAAARPEDTADSADDGSGIPKQQSAEEAADSEGAHR